MAVQGPLERHFAVVGAGLAADPDVFGLAVLGQAPQAVGGVVLPEHDALMPGQLGGRGRPAMLLEVAGGGAQQAAIGGDFPGDQPGVGDLAEADGDVDGLVGQVDRPVGQLQLYLHLGIALHEFGRHRGDIGAAEAERRIDAQQAPGGGAAVGNQPFQVRDVRQYPLGVLQVDLAFVGQADPAGGPVQQPHPQPVFQARQPLGHGGGGDVHLPGGGGQAAGLGQQDEEAQLGNLVHYY